MDKKRLLWQILSPVPNPRSLIPRTGAGWQVIKKALRRPTPTTAITFEEACHRYQVTDQQLQSNLLGLQRKRRAATVGGWFNIGLFYVGLALSHLDMVILGLLVALGCFILAFRWQFHRWQGLRRELAGPNDFFADRSAFFRIFWW